MPRRMKRSSSSSGCTHRTCETGACCYEQSGMLLWRRRHEVCIKHSGALMPDDYFLYKCVTTNLLRHKTIWYNPITRDRWKNLAPSPILHETGSDENVVWLTKISRVGDTPTINGPAPPITLQPSCTPWRVFIRTAAYDVSCPMEYSGYSLPAGLQRSGKEQTCKKLVARVGLVAVDTKRNIELCFNSEGM